MDAGEQVASPIPDAETGHDQLAEVPRNARSRREHAPDEHAAREQLPPLEPVRQSAQRKPDDGVEEREDGAEQSERRVAERSTHAGCPRRRRR